MTIHTYLIAAAIAWGFFGIIWKYDDIFNIILKCNCFIMCGWMLYSIFVLHM